jgi:hypothetical protein
MLYAYHTAIMATPPKKVEFIKHDSIPMIFVDTIDLWENKIASAKLKTSDENYYYAALTPTYPMHSVWWTRRDIMSCYKDKWETTKCFKMGGGLIPLCINYEVLINGDTVLIDTPDKFCETFAPVDNEQEAIAFAYIFTGSKPMYNLTFLDQPYNLAFLNQPTEYDYNYIRSSRDGGSISGTEGWDIFLPTITSSYVKKVDDGYELLLYYYVTYGCIHPYNERLIKVYFDGKVEILEGRAAFKKNSKYSYCVD